MHKIQPNKLNKTKYEVPYMENEGNEGTFGTSVTVLVVLEELVPVVLERVQNVVPFPVKGE
jgi:hypothetical protein